MKATSTLVFITLFIPVALLGNNSWRSVGARQAGLGGASVASIDLWSPANNQAVMAFCQVPAIGLYFNNAYFIKELNMQSIAGMIPIKKGAFGVSMTYFGYQYYHEINAGLSYAQRFGKYFSAAVQLDFLHLGQGNPELGDRSSVTFEVSIMGKITKDLTIGAHVFNPVGVKYNDYAKIPACYRIGMGWSPVKEVFATFEAEMQSNEKVNLKCGIEYNPIPIISIRSGFASLTQLWDFGIGLNFGGFSLDLTPTWNNMLGWSTHVSLSYHFKKREK
ncbi:MAG: hypothetical protein LBH92_08870 [Bacteroidales bacterium]|jgi:hypothetical protein|nr:hypothetical protein [Bacteroidales bacterium]